MKYLEIDFLEYAHSGTYVLINSIFRRKLFKNAIKVVGTKRKLAELIGSKKGTVNNWMNNKNYNKRKIPLSSLVKCCQILNLDINELRKNIITATLRYPAGDIKIRKWKIKFNEEFAEWLGMLDGDGSVSDRDVSFSNTYFGLTFHFAKFLQNNFGIDKNRMKIVITYYKPDSIEETNKIADQLKCMGLKRVKVYMVHKHKGKKINLKVQVCFKVLSQFLLNIRNDMKDILKASPPNIKSAYLRVYSASEGCASESKANVRVITITQKDDKELSYIRSLLEDVGIGNVDGPRFTGTGFQLGITTQKELNFQKTVGFGCHEDKNEKLKNMISHYKLNKYRKPDVRRYSCLK